MVEPRVPYSKVAVPPACWETNVEFESASCVHLVWYIRPVTEHHLFTGTFKKSFIFLVLDAESEFVGVGEMPHIILQNANIFEVLKSLSRFAELGVGTSCELTSWSVSQVTLQVFAPPLSQVALILAMAKAAEERSDCSGDSDFLGHSPRQLKVVHLYCDGVVAIP